jgi:hypothetical protein
MVESEHDVLVPEEAGVGGPDEPWLLDRRNPVLRGPSPGDLPRQLDQFPLPRDRLEGKTRLIGRLLEDHPPGHQVGDAPERAEATQSLEEAPPAYRRRRLLRRDRLPAMGILHVASDNR